MAKILNVSLQSIPEVIIINDDDNDLTILTEVEFHDLDIKLKMEYYLHLFVYDIHGDVDAPLVIPNWDDVEVLSIALDRKDDYLGVANVSVTADKKRVSIKTAMRLKLGKQSNTSSHFSKKLKVFATIAPAIGRSSKWSLPFESQIEY
ncbi:hypothetical protein [Psychroserpens luteus]|uniref:Immunity protein 50 n=1 Tax=Psychroserpens luteus TaxID=1434066 RepID=A0ABW5ZTY8_9FLAO|nr:hypothetical protein [Psychroserpens luteus]